MAASYSKLLLKIYFVFLHRYLVEFVLPGDQVLPRDDISIDSGFSDEEMEADSEGIEFPLLNQVKSTSLSHVPHGSSSIAARTHGTT